eukprot:2887004-Pleurochrysis_carterae.AAC.2
MIKAALNEQDVQRRAIEGSLRNAENALKRAAFSRAVSKLKYIFKLAKVITNAERARIRTGRGGGVTALYQRVMQLDQQVKILTGSQTELQKQLITKQEEENELKARLTKLEEEMKVLEEKVKGANESHKKNKANALAGLQQQVDAESDEQKQLQA